MIERLLPFTHRAKEIQERSIVKTISYRLLIIVIDFLFIYCFTKQIKVALAFLIVSNVYTTLAYYLHERFWDNIKWGKSIYKKTIVNTSDKKQLNQPTIIRKLA